MDSIKKTGQYQELSPVFDELKTVVDTMGAGVISEPTLLTKVAETDSRNHVYFLLELSDLFYRRKEDNSYNHRWLTEQDVATKVEISLKKLHNSIGKDELMSEEEILRRLRSHLNGKLANYDDDILRCWLTLSKDIDSNPLDEWGSTSSPNVRMKGIRDHAYLVVKRHGSPMHFREVAESIRSLFGRKAHEATTHNELIKDARFVLVGRGMYALNEWGYAPGVVKDVLRDILNQYGPLSQNEIIERVRKERYVKDNTIIVNLQDQNLFKTTQ